MREIMKTMVLWSVICTVLLLGACVSPTRRHVALPTVVEWTPQDQIELGREAANAGPKVQRAIMELHTLRQKIRALQKVYN